MTEDAKVAVLVSLAQAGIPPDIQELLTLGNPLKGVAPGALWNAFASFERDLSTNKDETIAKLRSAVEAALNWIDQDDCSQMGPAEDAAHTRIIRKLEAALNSTEKEG